MNSTVQELVTSYRKGDKEVTYALWMLFKPLIKKYLYTMAYNSYELEDLEQQSFILLINTLDTFDETRGVTFGAYYKMKLRSYRSLMCRKKTDVTSWSDEIEHQLYEQADTTVDIEKAFEDKECHKKLIKEMSLLEERDRQILRKYYLEWKSLKCISEELHTTYKAVACRKDRALRQLKQRLLI